LLLMLCPTREHGTAALRYAQVPTRIVTRSWQRTFAKSHAPKQAVFKDAARPFRALARSIRQEMHERLLKAVREHVDEKHSEAVRSGKQMHS